MNVKDMLTRYWKRSFAFFSGLLLIVGCSTGSGSAPTDVSASAVSNTAEQPIVSGYSNWAGWWPWAIAESEGLFAKHGVTRESGCGWCILALLGEGFGATRQQVPRFLPGLSRGYS